MTSRLLIRNGIVIDTDPMPAVTGHTDVLIEDGRIAAVGTGLHAPGDAELIDATDRIVLPGFVDTHRHTWQAGIRSLTPDISFAGYLGRIIGEVAPRYRPQDVYAGNLAGALECLDAGITTLVDWSHIQLTPAHTEATVEALRRAGIRAVLGYCYGGGGGPEELAAEGHRVHKRHFGAADPLLSMAIGALGPEIAGEEAALHEWRLARDLDLSVTVHMGGNGVQSAERGLAFLRENGLLIPRTTYIHPNHYTGDALKELADSGGTASISPIVEAELGIGYPATGRARAAGLPIALSADAVTSGPGDMFSLMRAAYALERARPDGAGMGFTTRDALRMATIEGAEVAGLGDVTGSLRPGKQADLVLLRTDTLAMAPAHDPIGAIALSADTGCVDTVLVAGRVVKRDGRLLHHDIAAVLSGLEESAAHLTAVP
ncbi:amidohydrolase family protein [Actinomadura sp. HBU206391]|uniref:amidohydrolase family protein n=1 Tax=Actinomadura sp. HBU206391 TaxID=2731692 RepID=UPI00164FD1A1|nr:amidohydrolase family protein [Actinomadura sp. HBU206391]MBC6456670.1 amidohydrolase family protein [Actinomadura sp. HBU206391]